MKYRGKISINDFCFLRFVKVNESDSKLEMVFPGAGTLQAYAREVLGLLRKIDGNPCGHIVLDAVAHHAGTYGLEISGLQLGPHEDRNALTLGDPDSHRAPGTGTPEQMRHKSQGIVRDLYGNPIRNPDPKKYDPVTDRNLEDVHGKGQGSLVRLLFTPGHWHGCKMAGMRADIVLFHELIHAYRFLRGRMSNMPMSLVHAEKTSDPVRLRQQRLNPAGSYPNREELLAVLLENIYQSCLGTGAPLRGQYAVPPRGAGTWNLHDSTARQTSGSLRAGNTVSETVMLENLGAITQLYEEERPLLTKINLLPATFNPFRDYARKYGQAKPAYAANWH